MGDSSRYGLAAQLRRLLCYSYLTWPVCTAAAGSKVITLSLGCVDNARFYNSFGSE